MGWGEAYRITALLIKDPASQLSTEVRGWTHPIERSDQVLRDLFDAFAQVNFKRPDPYARPWHPQPKKIGTASVTAEEFQALKRALADQN